MRNLAAAALDVGAVLVFVAIGRASHDEAGSLTGFVNTAWPFLGGLAVGWLATRAWRRRAVVLVPVGVGVWGSTVAVGMALRAVSGQGTAFSFIVVATLFTGLELLGWRLIAKLGRRVPAADVSVDPR